MTAAAVVAVAAARASPPCAPSQRRREREPSMEDFRESLSLELQNNNEIFEMKNRNNEFGYVAIEQFFMQMKLGTNKFCLNKDYHLRIFCQ